MASFLHIATLGMLLLGTSAAAAQATSAEVQHLYAEAQAAQGGNNTDLAIRDYLKILQLAPDIGPAYNNLGRIYFNQGRYSDAIRTLTKGLTIDPDMVPAKIMLGASYLATGQPSQALAPLQAGVQALPADRFARISLARADLALHQLNDALAQLQTLLAVDANDQEACYLAGKTYLQLSQEAFKKVQAIDPNTSLAHIMEGEVMESMQNTPGAITAYKQAIQTEGADLSAQQHLASLYWSTGDWAHAREQYEHLLEKQPRDCIARWHLADAMDQQGETPEAAMQHLNLALQQCPSLAEAHAERARLFLRSNQPKAALLDLQAAEKDAPDEPSIQQLLARCYRALGDTASAQTATQRFEHLQQQLHGAAENHARDVLQANQ